MSDWIDAHAEDAVALLKETVDIPSGTLNIDGVRQGRRCDAPRTGSGGPRDRVGRHAARYESGGSLVWTQGRRGKKFLLIGHLDTVFEEEDGSRPFERDGDIARGHGVYDMKTGNVIIVYALRALQQIGALADIPITVAYTGDEEKSGRPLSISRKEFIDAGQWADIALGFEEAHVFR